MRDSVLPGRGAILATVLSMSKIKEISIFVDESGTFVAQSDRNVSRYYILGMVLHDQAEDISTEVHSLEDSLSAQGLPRNHCVHAGPLIRREHEYAHLQREERRGIFQRMLAFVRKSNISYRCFRVDNHFNNSRDAIHDTLLQELTEFLIANKSEFNSYDL